MVIGFQDEIDDEDFLRPSQQLHPVTQISDSSDEEIPRHGQTSAAHQAHPTEKSSPIEDDLDDWLNGGSQPTHSLKSHVQSSSIKEQVIKPSVTQITTDAWLEDTSEDVPQKTEKASKKSKEKKSKRKSKKSSKDLDRSNSPCPDVNDQSRPHAEYEEI